MTIPKYDKDPELLKQFLTYKVNHSLRHANYKHTVDLAIKYKAYFTGDNQEDMVVTYKPAETDEQETQRVRLFNSITPHLCGSIMDTYGAVNSVKPLVNKLAWTDTKDDKKIQTLNDVIREFYEGDNVNKYLGNNFRRQVFYDPNAFLVVGFESFVNDKKIYPFPIEIPASGVFDFDYKNGVLDYVIAETHIDIIKDDKVVQGSRFRIYSENYVLELKEIGDTPEEGEVVIMDKLKKSFIFKEYFTGSKRCQAKRVGYLMDPATDFKTCVSPLFKADKILRDAINTKSELDLAKALHGFIQKFVYSEPCGHMVKDGVSTDRCEGGYMIIANTECEKCHGSGVKEHTTVQDIVRIKLDKDPAMRMDLSKYSYFQEIPVHMIQQLDADIEKAEAKAKKAVFNSDAFSRNAVRTTATEENYDNQYVDRELSIFGDAMVSMAEFIVTQSAIYNDIDTGFQYTYKLPSKFAPVSLHNRIKEREEAVTAQLPKDLIQAMDYGIAQDIFADNQISLSRYEFKRRYRPFNSLDDTEVQIILADLPSTHPDKILWIYFDQIVMDLEMMKGEALYAMKMVDVYAELEAAVNTIKESKFNEEIPLNPLRITA